MAEWDYGGAYLRYPCETGTVAFADGSRVKCHDIMKPLPRFMYDADLIFTDSPWNAGNLHSFYTKAELPPNAGFPRFMSRLFRRVAEIGPKICYLVIGKDYLADYVARMRKLYPYVTFYNATYYRKAENRCYVVRGSRKAKQPKFAPDADEEDIISWVCANEEYQCVGDLCMGRGFVGVEAYRNGRRFVGTELNHKRLSVLLERLAGMGLDYAMEMEVEAVNRTDCAKNETVMIRLSLEEKERWRKAATEEGMNLSVYVRHLVNNELKKNAAK